MIEAFGKFSLCALLLFGTIFSFVDLLLFGANNSSRNEFLPLLVVFVVSGVEVLLPRRARSLYRPCNMIIAGSVIVIWYVVAGFSVFVCVAYTLISVGRFCNGAVILFNGYKMPVCREAVRRDGIRLEGWPDYKLADSDTRLMFLIDRLDGKILSFKKMVSVGDVFLWIGYGALLVGILNK